MKKYPMKMRPVPREIIWGGDTLKKKYGKTAPFENIAESWELTVRDDAMSVIENGEYAGIPLCDYLKGEGFTEAFPLLIKFIDARNDLSVQVHPDDNVRDETGKSLGKTEMWYIIDADEGAGIIYGISDGYDVSDLAKLSETGEVEKCLEFVPVKKGDVFFIPAGQVHAIGKGILIAEIQQNSDTTYRLYDYGRLGADGKPRQLHIKEALAVSVKRSADEIRMLQFAKGCDFSTLANCDKFKTEIYYDNAVIKTEDGFVSVICTEGDGTLVCDGEEYPIRAGDTYFIPEKTSETVFSGKATLLCASVN